jgi:hypothetical protein
MLPAIREMQDSLTFLVWHTNLVLIAPVSSTAGITQFSFQGGFDSKLSELIQDPLWLKPAINTIIAI